MRPSSGGPSPFGWTTSSPSSPLHTPVCSSGGSRAPLQNPSVEPSHRHHSPGCYHHYVAAGDDAIAPLAVPMFLNPVVAVCSSIADAMVALRVIDSPAQTPGDRSTDISVRPLSLPHGKDRAVPNQLAQVLRAFGREHRPGRCRRRARRAMSLTPRPKWCARSELTPLPCGLGHARENWAHLWRAGSADRRCRIRGEVEVRLHVSQPTGATSPWWAELRRPQKVRAPAT
jgi:hypothetical protein